MKFSHCEEVRSERLLDILTDEDRGLRIIVSRHGAELVSLARRDADGSWTGFLYRDNEIDKPASGKRCICRNPVSASPERSIRICCVASSPRRRRLVSSPVDS